MARVMHVLREAVLWVAAALGTICLLVAGVAIVFGMTPLIFSSGSMSPGIPTGSLALAISTPAADLEPGDIVSVLWSDGERVTHRLVSSTPALGDTFRLTTRGDANSIIDPEQVTVAKVDRVVWSTPELGFVITEVTKPQWVFVLGVVVGGLVALAFASARKVEGAAQRTPRTSRRAPRHAAPRNHGMGGAGLAGVGVVVALALVASLLANTPTSTLAAFSDSGQARGSFTTKTVAAPTITGCSVTNNGLGIFQSVTLTWTMPAGYTATNAIPGAGATAGAMAPVSPAPTITGTGPYSVTYSSGLLSTLLGALLGKTVSIGVRSTEAGWNSTWATRTLSVGLAGLGSSCS